MSTEDELDQIRRAGLELGERIFNAVSEEDVAALRDRAFPELAPAAMPAGAVNPGILAGVLTFCRLALACKLKAEAMGTHPMGEWAVVRAAALEKVVGVHLVTEADRRDWDHFEARLVGAAFEEG